MSRVEVTQETTPLSDGILKTDLPIDGTLQVVKDQLNNSSTLQISNSTTKVNSTLTVAERLNIESDSTVTTQTSSVIKASTTNANLVIAPNGTGALIASVPDGTATGGNARGQYSVDLQILRTANTQVCSASYSALLGGENNTVAAGDSVIVAGVGNSLPASGGGFKSIVGGQTNTINGVSGWSFIGGGLSNTIGTEYSTISGGQSNTASTNTHATVVGGQSNVASGAHSVAGGDRNNATGRQSVSFGEINTSSGEKGTTFGGSNTASGYAAAAFGYGNSASSTMCFAFGQNNNTNGNFSACIGSTNQASGQYCLSTGLNAKSYLLSQFSTASNAFGVNGDAQQSLLTARREASLTTAATTVLSLDGTGVTNLIIPTGTNRAWNVTIKTIVVVSAITGTATGVTVGDVYSENKYLLFKKIGGVSSIVGTVDTDNIKSTGSMNTANLIITAGASQGMAITFTAPTFLGGGSITCRIVSKIELTEVAY